MAKKRKIRLNDEALAALKAQKELFVKKFGREPGPSDPVFFDPDSDVPIPMSEEKIDSILKKAYSALKSN